MSAPMILVLLSPEGAVRAKGVSSLSDPRFLTRSVQWMETDARNGQTFIGAIFNNRRVEYARTILYGYVTHFDPLFLFGERSEGKYHAPGVGLLYWYELPLLLIGAYKLVKNKNLFPGFCWDGFFWRQLPLLPRCSFLIRYGRWFSCRRSKSLPLSGWARADI